MLAKIYSAAVYGVDAYEVEIEVNGAGGDPVIVIVGLPDDRRRLGDQSEGIDLRILPAKAADDVDSAPRELAIILYALKHGGVRQHGVSELPHTVLSGRTSFVIDPEISDEELRRLHEAGARGIRLQRVVSGGINPQKIAQMAERLAPLGWHIQLFVGEEFFLDCPVDLNDLPVPVVIDHMAHFDPSQGTDGAGFRAFMRLLERGNVWAKISNCFFHAAIERARALVTTNPERCVWGSDWPHVVFRGPAPDDGALVDDLEAICGDEHTLELVVARNAGKLYFNEAA